MKKNFVGGIALLAGLIILIILAGTNEDSPDWISGMNDIIAETEYQATEDTELSEEEFLEKYLYGQWRFAERLVELDEIALQPDKENNFTDLGMEELKDAIVVDYERDRVWFPQKADQTTFTNESDAFVFGMSGGTYFWGQNPIYQIERMETNEICLFDALHIVGKGTVATLPGGSDYWKVWCHFNTSGHGSGLAGPKIYIDPEDPDTIYIAFCGLWRMERDGTDYDVHAPVLEERREERELTEEEHDIILKHVYGYWGFAEQVLASNDFTEEGELLSFTETGMEELKQRWLRLNYHPYGAATFKVPDGTFTYASDTWLFGLYGGFSWGAVIVYEVNEIDGTAIAERYGCTEQQMEELDVDDWLEVRYYTEPGNDMGWSRYVGRNAGDIIYIDPEDTDSIYIDFCGLWRMERDESNNSTHGYDLEKG